MSVIEFARLEAERRVAEAWARSSERLEPSDFDATEIESLSVRVDVELPGALWCQCCREALPLELVRGLRLDGRDDTYTSTAHIVTIDGAEHVRLCRECAAEFVSELVGEGLPLLEMIRQERRKARQALESAEGRARISDDGFVWQRVAEERRDRLESVERILEVAVSELGGEK